MPSSAERRAAHSKSIAYRVLYYMSVFVAGVLFYEGQYLAFFGALVVAFINRMQRSYWESRSR